MDLSRPVNSVALALDATDLLTALQQPGQSSTISDRIRGFTGQPVEAHYYPATAANPAFWLGRSGTYGVVLASGCSMAEHASQTLDGYKGGLGASQTEPVNQYFVDLAETIHPIMVDSGIAAMPSILLFGHSLGGAVLEVLVATQIFGQAQSGIKVLTFGAPKMGNARQAQLLTNVNLCRWMGSDDPVPILPPTTDDTLAVIAAYTPWQVRRFGYFVHPAGGLEIKPDLSVSEAELPSDASINVLGSLAGWLLAVDGSSASGHHIATYGARFGALLQRYPNRAMAPKGAPAEEPSAHTTRTLTREQTVVAGQLAAVQAELNETPQVIPPERLCQAVRLSRRIWAVVFAGETVSVTNNKRSARHLARAMNDFLRTLPKQGIVNPEALASQFSGFLAAATDPMSGIQPQLQTQLPGD